MLGARAHVAGPNDIGGAEPGGGDRDTLAERAARALSSALPHVTVVREALTSSYYGGVRAQFGANTETGEFCPIGGLGIQLAPLLFRDTGMRNDHR